VALAADTENNIQVVVASAWIIYSLQSQYGLTAELTYSLLCVLLLRLGCLDGPGMCGLTRWESLNSIINSIPLLFSLSFSPEKLCVFLEHSICICLLCLTSWAPCFSR